MEIVARFPAPATLFFLGGGGRETWSVIWKAKKGMVVFTLRLPEEGTEQ